MPSKATSTSSTCSSRTCAPDSCPYATVSIDGGIEALSIDVGGTKDETSFVSLRAPGVTDIAITGGVLDQNFALYLEEVNAKYEGADGNETRDHATLDATGYAGNVWVTGIDGGNVQHTYKIEIESGLGVGEKVRIVINGREGVIELKEVTAENGDAIAHFALEGELFDHTSAQRIIGSSDSLPSGIESEILRDVLSTELFQALP